MEDNDSWSKFLKEKRGNIFRAICLVFTLFIAIYILSTCSENENSEENISKKSTNAEKIIAFNHYFSGSLSGGINNMLNKLNSNTSNYKVKAVPIDHEAFKINIIKTIKSRTPADMYSYWAGAKTLQLVQQLEPIDKLWEEKNLSGVFSESVEKYASIYNGKHYLIPITQHFVGVIYNKHIFDKYKIKIPSNWSEFNKVCEELKNKKIIPISLGSKSKWPAQFWFDYILLRTQPIEYREKLLNGKAAYDDPQVLNVFKLWKNLIDKGYFNSKPNETDWDSGALNMVQNGKAAMTLMGTWAIGYYNESSNKWELGKDYDIFPFPIINSNIINSALGPIDGIVIPKNGLHKKEAMEVIEYFTNIDVQMEMSKGSGSFSPNIDIKPEFYSKPQQRLLKYINNTKVWAFNYDLSTNLNASEKGLDAFYDFNEFPNEYRIILKLLDNEMKLIYGNN